MTKERMKELMITVVIPAYNRKEILRKSLEALFDQTLPKDDYEIVIVDDGSTDGTGEMVKTVVEDAPCGVRYFQQENRGPAAARNVGIRNAKGRIILFMGDDSIATPTLLEEHADWHMRYPGPSVAVLGYVTWSPEIEVTPFMRWLENGGPQFAFHEIGEATEVDPVTYFYTCNISLKRAFLLDMDGFFDEEFPSAAWEDIELGHRLKGKGLVLKYNKKAVSYHHHATSVEDAYRRMMRVGETRRILRRKMGERNTLLDHPSLCMRLMRKGLSLILSLAAGVCYPLASHYEKRKIKGRIFRAAMKLAHRLGSLK
jgi:glycosyltransferase involved in cell wall biosynthesis